MATKWLLPSKHYIYIQNRKEEKGPHLSQKKAFPEIPRRSLLIGPNSVAWPRLTIRASGKCSFLKLSHCHPNQIRVLLGGGEWI